VFLTLNFKKGKKRMNHENHEKRTIHFFHKKNLPERFRLTGANLLSWCDRVNFFAFMRIHCITGGRGGGGN
jgi:hypothetical protein